MNYTAETYQEEAEYISKHISELYKNGFMSVINAFEIVGDRKKLLSGFKETKKEIEDYIKRLTNLNEMAEHFGIDVKSYRTLIGTYKKHLQLYDCLIVNLENSLGIHNVI